MNAPSLTRFKRAPLGDHQMGLRGGQQDRPVPQPDQQRAAGRRTAIETSCQDGRAGRGAALALTWPFTQRCK